MDAEQFPDLVLFDLAIKLGYSYNNALELMHAKNFPDDHVVFKKAYLFARLNQSKEVSSQRANAFLEGFRSL